MDKQLGVEYPAGQSRESFLKDNCDSVENKGYMKPFTTEKLAEMKENLAETSIQINDIELEKKAALAEFKHRTDPLVEVKKELLSGIKMKAEFVNELCYKFIDTDNKEVGFYNAEGNLIESRPAFADEMQSTIFQMNRIVVNS